MKFKKSVFVLLFLFGPPLLAGRWEVGVHPGVSSPGGSVNDLLLPSYNIQATLENYVTKRYSLGLEVGHASGHRMDGSLHIDFENDGQVEFVQAKSNAFTDVTQMGLFIKRGKTEDWGTWKKREVRRYFILGGAYYRTYVERAVYTLEGFSSTNINLEGQTIETPQTQDYDFGINVGWGFMAQIWTHFRLGIDLRYHRIFGDPKESDYYIPSLRFSYLFGEKPDLEQQKQFDKAIQDQKVP